MIVPHHKVFFDATYFQKFVAVIREWSSKRVVKIINLKKIRHEREVASHMSDGKAQGLQWSRYVVFLYRPAGSMDICINGGYLFIE